MKLITHTEQVCMEDIAEILSAHVKKVVVVLLRDSASITHTLQNITTNYVAYNITQNHLLQSTS